MSSSSEGPKNRQAGNQSGPNQQFSQHLRETHRIVVQILGPRLKLFFEGLNDLFFDLAEQAENNQIQSQYFVAIGDIRKNKDELTRRFATNVNVIFQKFKIGDYVYFIDASEESDESAKSLTLIKEDDLNQQLAIDNVIAKISQVFHEDLYMLNERFAEISKMNEISNHINPIGPEAIVNAFSVSLRVLKSGDNVKLMIIKLFEKNMIESLGPAYSLVNKYFKKNKILPEIKFEVRHPAMPGGVNNTINYLAHVLSEEDDNYKKIANILQHDREARVQYNPENIVAFSQLSDALDQIKSELFTDQELESRGVVSPLELKDELIKKLKSLKAMSKGKQINQADENTIDLIGRLFQYLVEDRHLPETIQLVLSKLQLPYLQIALKDEMFFKDKNNRPRQLLNAMAQASIGWSKETDDKGMFLKKVKEIVRFILKHHEKNINYEKLLERFVLFDQKLKKKVAINERRYSEKMSGRERLNQAKVAAADILKEALKDQSMPDLVRDLLLKPWANVLILSILRQQESPKQLLVNKNFVQHLVQASSADNSKAFSVSDIDTLCQTLETGLRMVAFDEQELQQKKDDLYACLSQIHGHELEGDQPEYISPADILKLSSEYNKDSSVAPYLSGEDPLQPPDDAVVSEDKHQDAAMSIKLGDWIEINSANTAIRAKLSWISPISGKLLFVNAKGAKVVDMFRVELAGKFRSKQYTPLKQIPLLMDRAMEHVMDEMASEQA